MIKKEITYEDFNGTERTEDFFFNLTKSEIAEMDMSEEGGLADLLRKMIAAKNQKQIIEMFKTILFKAYGEKSSDGRRFIKSSELSKAFSETNAYDKLFIELLSDEGIHAAEFIKGIIPEDLR